MRKKDKCITKACGECGGSFVVVIKNGDQQRAKRRYCSKSCASKALWRNPSTRAKYLISQREVWQRDDVRKRRCAGIKASWAKPERQAHKRALADHNKTPAARAVFSEQMKKAWRDPMTRPRLLKGLKKAVSNPAGKEKKAAHMRARWTNPEYRAKMIKANRARRGKPWVRKIKQESEMERAARMAKPVRDDNRSIKPASPNRLMAGR